MGRIGWVVTIASIIIACFAVYLKIQHRNLLEYCATEGLSIIKSVKIVAQTGQVEGLYIDNLERREKSYYEKCGWLSE